MQDDTTTLDLLTTFPIFRPVSAGTYAMWEPLILKEIQAFPDALHTLAKFTPAVPYTTSDEFHAQLERSEQLEEFAEAFSRHGSDKSSGHDYHKIYATLFPEPHLVRNVLEIGLGTFNSDVVSNMGANGKPGASLRAFRELFRRANIYGCDVDRRVLFEEPRIRTFFVDQHEPQTFLDLGQQIAVLEPDGFDLMIDDGLHAPTANLHALAFFIEKLAVGGYCVVEDIGHMALPVWQTVGALLRGIMESTIVRCRSSFAFVGRKRVILPTS